MWSVGRLILIAYLGCGDGKVGHQQNTSSFSRSEHPITLHLLCLHNWWSWWKYWTFCRPWHWTPLVMDHMDSLTTGRASSWLTMTVSGSPTLTRETKKSWRSVQLGITRDWWNIFVGSRHDDTSVSTSTTHQWMVSQAMFAPTPPGRHDGDNHATWAPAHYVIIATGAQHGWHSTSIISAAPET